MIRHRNRSLLGYALAATLALPLAGGIALAATPVYSHDSAAVKHGYGRAGGEAYWTMRERHAVPAPIKKAYDRTADWLSDLTEDWQSQPAPQQPAERLGREG